MSGKILPGSDNALLSVSTSGFWRVSIPVLVLPRLPSLSAAFDRACDARSDNGWAMQTVSTVNGYDGDALNLWFPRCHITRKRSSSTLDRAYMIIKRPWWIARDKLRLQHAWYSHLTIPLGVAYPLETCQVCFSLHSFIINGENYTHKIMEESDSIPRAACSFYSNGTEGW